MGKKIKISASIMHANWMHLEKDIRVLEKQGVDYIHYDIMDGFFSPDYCLGTGIINAIRENTYILSDYHLMVEEPSRILSNFTAEPGDVLSIHYEACRNLHRDLVRVRQMGFKVGVVLNPATQVNAIEYIVEEADVVEVMTVNPGYAGQKLVSQTLRKIEVLDRWRNKDGFEFEIAVDGNVNEENIPKMAAAGADILIGDSSGLFVKGQQLEESIAKFRSYAERGLADKHKAGS